MFCMVLVQMGEAVGKREKEGERCSTICKVIVRADSSIKLKNRIRKKEKKKESVWGIIELHT